LSGTQYTVAEVAFLLALSHEDAIDISVAWSDSLAKCTHDGPAAPTTSEDWDPPMLIARWHDVQAAKRRAQIGKLRLEILRLRVAGYTELEVAQLVGLGKKTAARRFRASLDEILEELGGVATNVDAPTSSVPACMSCATRPRTRRTRMVVRLRGTRYRRVLEEGQSSLCAPCLEQKS
jgi:hypothetical protein